MVTTETVREIAMALPGTEERDHFGMPSFRVNNRIFSTLWIHENKAMVKLSPFDQSVFVAFDNAIFYPVPNKWGLQGATFIELARVPREMLKDALTTAWQAILDKKKRKVR